MKIRDKSDYEARIHDTITVERIRHYISIFKHFGIGKKTSGDLILLEREEAEKLSKELNRLVSVWKGADDGSL